MLWAIFDIVKFNRTTFASFGDYKASAVVLIAANALPLFGVLFLGWDTFSIVLLYWSENVVIGAINVLKMLTCAPDLTTIYATQFGTNCKTDGDLAEKYASTARRVQFGNQATKLFMIPFFIFHYGMFCLVHGIFVFVLFGHDQMFGGPLDLGRSFWQIAIDEKLLWCLAAIAGSHLFSFFVNYIGQGEYRRTTVPLLMAQPYGRIVVLHIAIIFGAFVSMALGSNVGILIILIVGKTLMDLALHLRERERNAADADFPPVASTAPESAPLVMPDVIPGEASATTATLGVKGPLRPPVHPSSGG